MVHQTARGSSRQSHVFSGRYYLWLAGVNTFAAALASFFMPGSDSLVKKLLATLIYAHSIGWLAGTILPYASRWIEKARPPFSWLALGLALLLITGAGCMVAGIAVVGLGYLPLSQYWEQFISNYRFSAIIALAVGGGAYFYRNLRSELEETALELRTRQLEEERAHKLAAQARLSALASRVHPHFLFNTLNSIASLIPDDPQRAEEVLEKLSALLHYSLDGSQGGVVPLRKELELVRDYLAIEKTRFGERLRYSIQAPEELGDAVVPPVSIQTLVENSVKYAVSSRRDGGEIRIRIGRLRQNLLIEVSDNGPGFTEGDITPGHGLHNLRSLLSALYGPTASLEIVPEAGSCTVRLTLPHATNAGGSA